MNISPEAIGAIARFIGGENNKPTVGRRGVFVCGGGVYIDVFRASETVEAVSVDVVFEGRWRRGMVLDPTETIRRNPGGSIEEVIWEDSARGRVAFRPGAEVIIHHKQPVDDTRAA